MIKTADLLNHLDHALPDSQAVSDVLRVLSECADGKEAEIEIDEKWLRVPTDTDVKVIRKSLQLPRFGTGFGTYLVEVAIGGVTSYEHGIVTPKHCFALLYYNQDKEMITIDFYSRQR